MNARSKSPVSGKSPGRFVSGIRKRSRQNPANSLELFAKSFELFEHSLKSLQYLMVNTIQNHQLTSYVGDVELAS